MAIRETRFSCWMTKATNTHSGFVIFIVFHDNSGYLKALQCYVIRILPVVLKCSSISTRPSVWFPFFKCYNKGFCACMKWNISSGVCFSGHKLFDLIAMKIRDKDDQFTEFNEILNFLENGNFPIYDCINMEILKYASPRIKDPFLTTSSCLPVCMWSVD